MGMSIHYRGTLNYLGEIDALVDELTDIAETLGWDYTTLDEDWSKPNTATVAFKKGKVNIGGHLPLKGVSLQMHGSCGSTPLYFDAEGHVRCPIGMTMIHDGEVPSEEAWVSVKTQERSCQTHVALVKLLRYLKKRYVCDLEVRDEGEYWDTGDRQKLEENMTLLNGKLQHLSATISSGRIGDLTGLSADEIASRIERLFANDKD